MKDGYYKIKTWKEMSQDYGVTFYGKDIPVKNNLGTIHFTKGMEKTMPVDRTIYIKDDKWNGYVFTSEMIKESIGENKMKYKTKKIENYPDWLKDIPRGKAVLCDVWDDSGTIGKYKECEIVGYDGNYYIDNLGMGWINAEPIRESETKELTMEELEKELGHKVKIVKEK